MFCGIGRLNLHHTSHGQTVLRTGRRAQQRGFSRAVTTEGGKTIWLAGETGTPGRDFDTQVKEVFAALDKTIKASGGAGLRTWSP